MIALKLDADNSSDLTDEDLKLLRKLPNLRWVSFRGSEEIRVSERGLAELAHCRKLQRLDLTGHIIVSDDLVQELAKLPRLEALYLANTRVSDRGVSHLRQLSKLRALDLRGTKITHGAFPALGTIGSLEYLWFGATAESKRELIDYVKAVPHLAELNKLADPRMLGCFPEFGFTTYWGARRLRGEPVLREHTVEIEERSDHLVACRIQHASGFDLREPRFPGSLLRSVRNLERTRELDLRFLLCKDEDLQALSNLRGLEKLDVGGSPLLTGAGLEHIRQLPSLRYLNLKDTLVGDDDISCLASFPALLEVDVSRTRFTQQGIDELSRRATRVQVNTDNVADSDEYWTPYAVERVKGK